MIPFLWKHRYKPGLPFALSPAISKTTFDMKNLEQDNITGINHTGRRANNPVKRLAASSILGDKIYNPAGEHLGRIMDIMLNVNDGKIEYIVIEFGGFFGMGQKYFAVPFQALSINTERHAFILNKTRASLQNVPGFDRNHWPETNAHKKSENTAHWGGFMGANTGSEY